MMNTEYVIEELPNARIEGYEWGLGIRPKVRRRPKVRGGSSGDYLGLFEEVQVQPDGTILGIHTYGDQSRIEQVVLPTGAYTDRYHNIVFLDTPHRRMIARWGAFACLLSEKNGKPLNRRNYHEITPLADDFYHATFGANRYILDENGHVVASKKVAMPWKKRRKDIDLNHLLGPLKNTDFI